MKIKYIILAIAKICKKCNSNVIEENLLPNVGNAFKIVLLVFKNIKFQLHFYIHFM